MPPVPAQIDEIFQQIKCTTVIKDDPVSVALYKEFHALVHLAESWATCKKKDRRKHNFEPEAAARKAAAALEERKAAAAAVSITGSEKGEEQPTAADEPHTEPSDDVCATAPAEKRSRVVSGVSETQGTADLPAAGLSPEKPKTKAARTRTRKLKDLTSESELAAPSSHEDPDISQHQVEVATTADAPDSVAAGAVVDIPVDEDMANTDEHDDTVMADVEAQQDETLDAEDLGRVSDAPPSGDPSTSQQQSPPFICSVTPSGFPSGAPPSQPVSESGVTVVVPPEQLDALVASAGAVPAATPAQEDQTGVVLPPVQDGDTPPSAPPDAQKTLPCAQGTAVGPHSVPVQETAAADPEQVAELESVPAAPEVSSAVEPPALSDAPTPTVQRTDVVEGPSSTQQMDHVAMTPTACENEDASAADQQIASLGPAAGPNISAQVQSAHQTAVSAGRVSQVEGGHDIPALDLSLSQVPALQVVDNPLQAVTPVAFGSQPRPQVVESPAPHVTPAPQGVASGYGGRTSRLRRTSVHVTAASECVKSPRVTGTFSWGGYSSQHGRVSRPVSVQPEPSNPVPGPEGAPAESPGNFAMDTQPDAGEEPSAAFQPTPTHVSPLPSAGEAPNSVDAGIAAPGSSAVQPPVTDPATFMEGAKSALENAPMSVGPTSAGLQWPANTPILQDEGDDAEEEGIPAWSSDGGSADENAGDTGGAQAVPEDELPFCDERTGANVVDMHELEPHETPSPLPEGVWPQAAEQAAEAVLSGLYDVAVDSEGNRSASSTPRFCEGGAGGTQDFSQPVSRVPTITLPLMDSQQTVRSPLADCHPVDTDTATAVGEGLPMIQETNAESVHQGAVLSPVEVEQGPDSAHEAATEPAAEQGNSDKGDVDTEDAAVPSSCPDAPGEVDAAEAKPSAAPGGNAAIGRGGLLAQLRNKMLAQKAAATEKETKQAKQPIAALAKAAKVREEQQRVQEEREARKKALEKERAAQKQKAAAPAPAPAPAKLPAPGKETRIPTTPTARKALQDLKKTQAGPSGVPAFIPACRTPGPFPSSTLHNNVNATPRAQALMMPGLMGTATPKKWRAPTPGPQYPITPEDELEDSDEDESSEARDQKAKFQAPWATSDKLKLAVKRQKYMNPEALFGTFEPTCNLLEMMGPAQSEKELFKYTVKRKSRNWGADAITRAEIDSFSRKKGYHPVLGA